MRKSRKQHSCLPSLELLDHLAGLVCAFRTEHYGPESDRKII
ncbi:MAG TPA: hypothetical protein VGP08_21305 [Pyrinomonadaceae bacterium]|nr:hypothetical protein [Pyrinomonadaceae bacterium]